MQFFFQGMRCLTFILVLLLIAPVPDYAAFPAAAQHQSYQPPAPLTKHGNEKEENRLSKEGGSGFIGVVSVILGLGAFLALLLGTNVALFALLGLLALLLGIIGLRRKPRGFGIAGLVLGIASIAVLVLAIVATSNYK